MLANQIMPIGELNIKKPPNNKKSIPWLFDSDAISLEKTGLNNDSM